MRLRVLRAAHSTRQAGHCPPSSDRAIQSYLFWHLRQSTGTGFIRLADRFRKSHCCGSVARRAVVPVAYCNRELLSSWLCMRVGVAVRTAVGLPGRVPPGHRRAVLLRLGNDPSVPLPRQRRRPTAFVQLSAPGLRHAEPDLRLGLPRPRDLTQHPRPDRHAGIPHRGQRLRPSTTRPRTGGNACAAGCL